MPDIKTSDKRIEIIRLKNSLPLIFVDMPGSPSCAIAFMTRVGARDGGKEKAEIAHITEHLLFDGTKKFPDRNGISVAIDEIGGQFGGETYEEYTNYYIKSEPRSFEKSATILGEMASRSLFETDQLEKEKEIISQELNLRDDDPVVKITDFLQETVFPNQSLGLSRKDSRLSLARMSRQDVLSFWADNYVADNSVLVVCGDKNKLNKFAYICESQFGQLARDYKGVRDRAKPEEKPLTGIVGRKTAQAHFAFGVRSYSRTDRRIHAMKLLDVVLGHSFSSRLVTEIREKRKLAYAVFSHADSYSDTGIMTVYAGVDIKRLEEAVLAVYSEMKKITDDKSSGIKDNELVKAKNFLRGNIAVGLDNPGSLADYYARRLLLYGDTMLPEDLMSEYDKVERQELVEIARDLFRPEKINLVAMGENIKGDKLRALIS